MAIGVAFGIAFLIPAWAAGQTRVASPAVPSAASASAAAAPAVAGRLFVLMINGGGSREENFQSHVAHLRELTAHLLAAQVPKDRITILSSDGADPAPDMATRNPPPTDFWLLDGTPLADALQEPLRFENSVVPGMPLLPATRTSLTHYLRQLRGRVNAADTLLVYVTDHGTNNPRDPLRNQITLWGPRESINVRQLGAELGQLPAGLRVVTVMSQCFSGAFARLRETLSPAARSKLSVCGYFSSPADRPAYGCFPEVDRENRTGHAFTLIDSLGKSNRLPDVHADVLLRDHSPDVPQRSSDVYLHDVLRKAAERSGSSLENYADRLLNENRGALRNKIPAFALAEQLARAYGLSGPLTFEATDRGLDELATVREALGKHQSLWQSALSESTRAQLEEFLVEQPAWRPRLRPQALRALTTEARASLTRELLAALRAFGDARPALTSTAVKLVARVDEAAALAYRLDVREAAFQRVRGVLINAAARAYLVSAFPGNERHELAKIERCESLELPVPPPGTAAAPVAAPEPMVALAADVKAAAALRPAYLGIAFRAPPVSVRRRFTLSDGAALITAVVPRSPAALAGLAPGDIIVGEPGRNFVRENQVRAFTMLSPVATALRLELLRQGTRMPIEVKLTPVPAAN